MPTPLFTLFAWLESRREHTERGDVVGWMMMAILAAVVGAAMIVGMTGVGSAVMDKVKSALGV